MPPPRDTAAFEVNASVFHEALDATALDDGQERRGRLLHLGKGAVLAHRLAPPLAVELDETEQSGSGAADVGPR